MWLVLIIVYLLLQEMAIETGQSDFNRKKTFLFCPLDLNFSENAYNAAFKVRWDEAALGLNAQVMSFPFFKSHSFAWDKPCTSRGHPVLS